VWGVWPAAISRKEETRASCSAGVGGAPAMAGGGAAGPCCVVCVWSASVCGVWWGLVGERREVERKRGWVRGDEEDEVR
jgi:hypothetical protein